MKRSLAVLLAIALTLMAVLPVAAGGGGTTTTVQTGAQITGAGDDPFVKAKWESPDMDPCKAGVQIIPNPAGPLPGQGGETEVWVYAVVSDPNGIADVADVYFKIFHPDGSFKLQVHMSKVPCWQAIGLVKDAAAKGLIKFAEGYDLEDVLWQLDCEKKQAELWVGKWIYEIHQPAGWYTTEVTVVDTDGGIGKFSNSDTEIVSIVQLALDFTSIDWGNLKPGVPKWISGDDNFVPGDGKPTVWNQGNDPASLRIHNSALVGAKEGKEIVKFDVRMGGEYYKYLASQWVTLIGPLLPCTPRQIEFSVFAPEGLPKDTYSGTMDFEIIHYQPPA